MGSILITRRVDEYDRRCMYRLLKMYKIPIVIGDIRKSNQRRCEQKGKIQERII
jgi:hypothetical protein